MKFTSEQRYPGMEQDYHEFSSYLTPCRPDDRPDATCKDVFLTKAALAAAEYKGISVYEMVDPKRLKKYAGMALIYREGSLPSYIEVNFNIKAQHRIPGIIVHELAHILAKHKKSQTKNERELIAESVSYLVMSHFGIQTKQYSNTYIRTRFQSDVRRYELAQKHSNLILSISGTIATDMRTYLRSLDDTVRVA